MTFLLSDSKQTKADIILEPHWHNQWTRFENFVMILEYGPQPPTPRGGRGENPPHRRDPNKGTHRQEGEGAKDAQGGPHPAGRGTPKGDPDPARRGAPPGDPTRGEREEKESR